MGSIPNPNTIASDIEFSLFQAKISGWLESGRSSSCGDFVIILIYFFESFELSDVERDVNLWKIPFIHLYLRWAFFV